MENKSDEVRGFEKAMDLLKALGSLTGPEMSDEEKHLLLTAVAFLHWKKIELYGGVARADSTMKDHLAGCKETNS